ncbi:MAG: SDR family oxidoreductase, partial [Clostridia bacterium]|nr:SDR family oxidoreductase [Clostridia bacterium]
RCITLTLAKEGYNIIATYNSSREKALTLEKELKDLNTNYLILKCDISNEDEVKELVTKSIKKFEKIDCLCNNAGISIDSLFYDKTVENFQKTLNVNLIGTFLVSKYVGQEMMRNKKGNIVNLSSTNGINTYFPMCLDYDCSKAGINNLTHNLAMQFSPYVNVNAIAPGFIKTESEIKDMDEEFIKMEEEKIFLKRGGTEQDVANLVKFLFSDEASFINSAVIRIDGGTYGSMG